MPPVQQRYSKEEIARRGDAIYDSQVRPNLKPEHKGKFVALDIETGAYEVAKDELVAVDRLRSRIPDAQVWLVRVGFPYVHRFGRCETRGNS
jgi:hypothetical protein